MARSSSVGDSEGSSGVASGGEATAQQHINPGNGRDLDKELWHACAGPLVYVPEEGEKVFYLPQGHQEQIESYTNGDVTDLPIYNLPPKMLCRVVQVHLKADPVTDEVFAVITLLPLTEHDENSSNEDENYPSLPPRTAARSFSKKLTTSDTSTHGGFSIPKRHAFECLPPLNMTHQPPNQKIIAKDVHGSDWCFRHIFRGQPKRHLLTTGWSTFVSTKKLVTGDTLIFLRGDNGELRIGIRRASKQQTSAATALISASSMKHGILASAFHANTTGTRFTVYYHPWTCSTEFIISYDQYIKSAEFDYRIGTRFKMLYEAEDCTEQRIDSYEGTIIGIEDVDPIRWPNSEWRALKVQWDAIRDAFVPPERVSHWNIELLEPIKKKQGFLQRRPKRARSIYTWSPGLPRSVNDDLLHSPVEYATQSQSEVLQGQESRDTGVNELDVVKPPLTINPEWNHAPVVLENQLKFPMPGPLYLCPSSSIPFSGSRVLSVPKVNSEFQDWNALELKDEVKVPLVPQTEGGKCKLFGVNLNKSPSELPSPQVSSYSEHESPYSVPTMCLSSSSGSSKNTSGIDSEEQCKNSYSSTNQRCAKVLKYGSAHWRSVDIGRFRDYGALICELDHLFNFKGSLINGSSGWHVTYLDDDEDLVVLGDYPWQKFQFMVRRIFVCPKEGTDGVNQKLIKSDASSSHA